MSYATGESNTRRFLDASTAHLTERTADRLLAGSIDVPVLTYDGAPNMLVYVPSDDALKSHGPIPVDLLHVWQRARSLGCVYVMFDADAPTVDDLPTYDW